MITLETLPGDNFVNVAKKAKAVAIIEQAYVGFNFNGIECRVDEDTNLDWLLRDYHNAHTMDWEKVGPFCDEEYTTEVQAELGRRLEQRRIEAEKSQASYLKAEVKKKAAFEKKTRNSVVEFRDKLAWDEFKAANLDGYGGGVMTFAENWAKLMQVEMENGASVADVAAKASFEADTEGITGFMYGCAVQILSKSWLWGEDLRKWHNKKYGHDGKVR